MIAVTLDPALVSGLDRFIAERDAPPDGRMSRVDAVNVIVQDWLMGQGYLPLPDETTRITPALQAADVPRD